MFMKIIGFSVASVLIMCQSGFSKTRETYNYAQQDSMELLTQYSLFAEYYKNRDYKSAEPYGWKVIELNPVKFNKWIYYKMEDVLWYMHDSTNATPQQKQQYADTTIYLYNMAQKYYPTDKGYFEARKAYVEQTWLHMNPDTLISDYQQAFKDNPKLPAFYYDKLGQLYKDNMNNNNDYRQKAVDLYSMLSDREPNNDLWPDRLQNLVTNDSALVPILKQTWMKDKTDQSKAWKYASIAMQANMPNEAIEPLKFLVDKSPKTVNYWEQLASAYRKTDKMSKAEDAYKKLIALEPDNKDHYLNLGIVYSQENKYVDAREAYEKASRVGKGWGLPIYYEGLLYEQAATKCGTFDFNTKMVYQLAVETYRRAKSMDPSLGQAEDRIKALSASVPTKEDYFFRNLAAGKKVPIKGDCFTWINRDVTIP